MTTAAVQATRHLLDTAGKLAGLRTEGAELIRDGANVLYRLPASVVARIGRDGTQPVAQREVQASRWLAKSGIAVVHALDDIEQPTMVENRPVTWWQLLPEHRPATPAELGAVLRRLHSLPIPAALELPELDPFDGLAERIDAATTVPAADRTWLRKHLAKLQAAHAEQSHWKARCVVHGDAWQGNIVKPEHVEPILLDLEHISIGHPAWDLVSLAVDRTDFERISAQDYRAFTDAYGGTDITTWPNYRTLAAIRELRWVCFVLSKAGINDEAARETRHRLACLRGEVTPPWSWSAF